MTITLVFPAVWTCKAERLIEKTKNKNEQQKEQNKTGL